MIDVVYFSSVSEQTKRFVEKLDPEVSYRIPLRRNEEPLVVDRPYVLITPSYGAGTEHRAVPPQVIKFLNNEQNRSLIRGVVAGGNRNYGSYFGYAGGVVAKKCNVPVLGHFEVFGMPGEAEQIRRKIGEAA